MPMSTGAECVCCQEIDCVLEKCESLENPAPCITSHEGFETVCLDVWVLQTAYFVYRERYGSSDFEGDPQHQ